MIPKHYIPALYADDFNITSEDKVANCPVCGKYIVVPKYLSEDRTPVCYRCYAELDQPVNDYWFRFFIFLASTSLMVMLLTTVIHVFLQSNK